MKKVLALVLAAMLVMSMAPMALAAPDSYGVSGKGAIGDLIESIGGADGEVVPLGVNPTYDLDEAMNPNNNEAYVTFLKATPTFETVKVGDDNYADTQVLYNNQRQVTFIEQDPITLDFTVWNYEYYSRKDVKDLKLDPKLRVTNGQRVVDKVEWSYTPLTATNSIRNDDVASVKVVFVEKFISTGDVDYKFVVYLSADKKRMDNTEVTFEGNFANKVIKVDEDDVYVYIGDKDDAHVIESLAYIKDMEIELSDGISIFTKLFNNKKYYAYGEGKVQSSDDDILTKYPSIDNVYHIDSINLNNSYSLVKLDIGGKLFVYDANLNYVGTTDEKLPFSSAYYVSAVELDIDEGDVTEPTDAEGDEGDGFEPGADTGGDDVPENVNDNPGTGC